MALPDLIAGVDRECIEPSKLAELELLERIAVACEENAGATVALAQFLAKYAPTLDALDAKVNRRPRRSGFGRLPDGS